MAQQDSYQTLVQHYEGNEYKWQHQTGYAICQPNGQVLALLNSKGRTLWRKEKQTLWGLCFPNEYKQPSPLDPQMLFAGQWQDEESGLAYNRFRYYDPATGNYLSSDPIGLLGGERPFSYVGNPMDWVDLFGLAGCPKNKLDGLAREKRAKDILERRYGKENVLSERILRDSMGNKVIDPLTNSGRRVDFVVKGKDGVWRPVEITSMTADKVAQLAKERNINALGGNFVRHPKTGELIKIDGISTVIRAK